MASLKELIVNIKTKLNQSELVQGVNAIKQQINNIKDPHITPKVNISPALAEFRKMKQAYQETKLGIKEAYQEAKLEIKTKAREEVGKKFASGVSTTEAVGLGLGLAAVTKEAISFEDHMLGVAKQVNGARDASGNLTQVYTDMREQIQELSKRSPISPNDIADIVTAGARMNVAKEDLMGFTETAIKMGTAFEAPAADIADQMGKVANVFKIPIKNIDDLAGSINYLDDNAISKGADIIEVLQRTGAPASAIGLTSKNVAALGSTFLSLGKAPEVASTSINSLITTLSTLDASKVGKAGDDFKRLGLTTAQVQKGMATDAQGTIELVLDKLSQVPKEQRILAATNIFGKQFGDDIITISGNMEEYRRQLKLANSEAAKASLNSEYEARLKTTSAQLEIFKNKLSVLAVEVGSVAVPALIKLVNAFTPIINAITTFAKENPTLVATVLSLITALIGMKLATMGLMLGVGALGTGFKALQVILWLLGVRLQVATTAQGALNLMMRANPIGLVITAVALLAAGLYYLATHWDKVKQVAKNALDGIRQISATVTAAMQNAFNSLIDGIVNRFIWLYNKAREVWTGIKSIFSGGNLSANANVKATIDNLSMRNTPSVPQAALSSYQQTYNNAVANNQKANTVNNNQKVTIQVAPNNSATQAQDIHKELEAQYRGTMRLAGTGFR